LRANFCIEQFLTFCEILWPNFCHIFSIFLHNFIIKTSHSALPTHPKIFTNLIFSQIFLERPPTILTLFVLPHIIRQRHVIVSNIGVNETTLIASTPDVHVPATKNKNIKTVFRFSRLKLNRDMPMSIKQWQPEFSRAR
jgi:hypothetical protein